MPRIVLAPDKFKGSLSAEQVVAAMAAGCADAGWDAASVTPLAIADGGDGSVAAALRSGWQAVTLPTVDAWGATITSTVATHGDRAILEVADICGMGGARLTPEHALSASSSGVGQVVRALLDRGFADVVVGLGGSATTDGGAGMLTALGVRLLDAAGVPVAPGGGGLAAVAEVDPTGLDPRLADVRLTVACDVDTPMVGVDGSAEVFAPQKGADEDAVAVLASGLARLAAVVEPAFGRPRLHAAAGTGAAGGLAWAGVLLGARVRSGAALFLDMLGARDVLAGADVLITGEGSLDAQSLRGKGPVAVATLAAEFGVPALAVVGTNRLPDTSEPGPFVDVAAIDRIDPRCVDDAELSARLVRAATSELLSRHAAR